MIAMGVIERSEAAYASPLVLVKKADGSYRVCVNFKELNKITVFDPEPIMGKSSESVQCAMLKACDACADMGQL